MARLSWGGAGTRYYEAGVDRGVLYVGENAGVPWNGLKTVTESSSGGDVRVAHIDGVKYLNIAKNEDFEATIEAFYSPKEFDACDGMLPLEQGLWATQQRRQPFGLSYRTLIGSDTKGINHGYKIHLVYNAIASPSQRTHNTLSEVADAGALSWALTAKPVRWPGVKPTAHLIIDSTSVDPILLAQLENIIYGTDEEAARLPYPAELQELFVEYYDDIIVMVSDGVTNMLSEGEAFYSYAGGWGTPLAETANELWVGTAPHLTTNDDTSYAHVGASQVYGTVPILKLAPTPCTPGASLRITARVRLTGAWDNPWPALAFVLGWEGSTASTSVQGSVAVGSWQNVTLTIPWTDELEYWVPQIEDGTALISIQPGMTGAGQQYDVSYIKAELISDPDGVYAISSVNGRIIALSPDLYQITSRYVEDLGNGLYQITSSV